MIPTLIEYADPRLVALYDGINPFAADTSFYIKLAKMLSASTIIDLGCGTGLLTCQLAHHGHDGKVILLTQKVLSLFLWSENHNRNLMPGSIR